MLKNRHMKLTEIAKQSGCEKWFVNLKNVTRLSPGFADNTYTIDRNAGMDENGKYWMNVKLKGVNEKG